MINYYIILIKYYFYKFIRYALEMNNINNLKISCAILNSFYILNLMFNKTIYLREIGFFNMAFFILYYFVILIRKFENISLNASW